MFQVAPSSPFSIFWFGVPQVAPFYLGRLLFSVGAGLAPPASSFRGRGAL